MKTEKVSRREERERVREMGNRFLGFGLLQEQKKFEEEKETMNSSSSGSAPKQEATVSLDPLETSFTSRISSNK